MNSLNSAELGLIYQIVCLPVVNVVVLLQGTLGPLDQFRNTGPEMITHLRVLSVRRVVILRRLNVNLFLGNTFIRCYLIKAAHVILRAGYDAVLLLLHKGDHPDDILLADVAVGVRLLHEAVAGLVEEALRRLPVLGGGGVEEVVETLLAGFTFPPALGVTLHEKVNVDQVSVLQRTFLWSCPNCCSVNPNDNDKSKECT